MKLREVERDDAHVAATKLPFRIESAFRVSLEAQLRREQVIQWNIVELCVRGVAGDFPDESLRCGCAATEHS